MSPPRPPLSPNLQLLTNPEALWTPSCEFLWRLHYIGNWLNHRSLAPDSRPSNPPPTSPEAPCGAKSSNPPITGNQPHPQEQCKGHLINITKTPWTPQRKFPEGEVLCRKRGRVGGRPNRNFFTEIPVSQVIVVCTPQDRWEGYGW